jgi:hypothetical protein
LWRHYPLFDEGHLAGDVGRVVVVVFEVGHAMRDVLADRQRRALLLRVDFLLCQPLPVGLALHPEHRTQIVGVRLEALRTCARVRHSLDICGAVLVAAREREREQVPRSDRNMLKKMAFSSVKSSK